MASFLHIFARWYTIIANLLFLFFFIACGLFCGLVIWHPTVLKQFAKEHVHSRTHKYQTGEEAEDAVMEAKELFGPLLIGSFWACVCGTFLCGLGIVAAAKKSRHILWFYIILFSAVLITEFVTLMVFFGRPDLFNYHLKNVLDQLVTNYVSEDSRDSTSRALNHFMIEYQCCGSNDVNDFQNAELFKEYREKHQIPGPLNPTTCCALYEDRSVHPDCTISSMTKENSNIHRGCWTEILRVATRYGLSVAYGWLGAMVVQVTIIVASAHLIWHKKNTWGDLNQWYANSDDQF
ncbi:hypothetical protein CSKR_108719 [Clonorchis sinensis]|uniref:Uncharacterized protein n=2 Tax=Clonorchis sinensis TaxID=79923 RepID=A0A8T1LXQ5_CLOSI|nr:hypothetical protein CSKR_108719 [Clonorchis sinensis]GAA53669.1 tetraspanin-16 [Clonorchis sinensis]